MEEKSNNFKILVSSNPNDLTTPLEIQVVSENGDNIFKVGCKIRI